MRRFAYLELAPVSDAKTLSFSLKQIDFLQYACPNFLLLLPGYIYFNQYVPVWEEREKFPMGYRTPIIYFQGFAFTK